VLRNESSNVAFRNYTTVVPFGWWQSTGEPPGRWSDFDISDLDQLEENNLLNDFLRFLMEMEELEEDED
jgi:hypothetical protein